MVVQSISLVADLRNQNRNISDIFIASGLLLEGDSGGGIFIWIPTSTAADDGVDIIQVTGVSIGRWIRTSESVLSPISGSGQSGQVAYWNGINTQTGSNSLFWDISNNRLGIGTTTPSSPLHVRLNTNSTTKSDVLTQEVHSSTSGYTDYFKFQLGANQSRGGRIVFGELGGTFPESYIEFALNATNIYQGGEYPIFMTTNGILRMSVSGTSGNIILQNGGIYVDNNVDKLQVTGSGRFTSSVTANSWVY